MMVFWFDLSSSKNGTPMRLSGTGYLSVQTWLQGVLLCLFLFAASLLYSSPQTMAATAEPTPMHTYGAVIEPGNGADFPCHHSPADSGHNAHLNCASGTGPSFIAVITQTVMPIASSKLALRPGRSLSLASIEAVTHFHPPRSSAHA